MERPDITRRQFLRAIALGVAATFAGKPLLVGLLALCQRALAWLEAQRAAAAAAARLAMLKDQIRYQSMKAMEAMCRTMVMQYYGEPQHIFYYDPAVLKKIAVADAYGVVTDVDHHANEITVDFPGRPPYEPVRDLEWDDYIEPEGPFSYRSSFTFDFRVME